MTDKEYIKAFKCLTSKLKQALNDKTAALCLTIANNNETFALSYRTIYRTDDLNVIKEHFYFFDESSKYSHVHRICDDSILANARFKGKTLSLNSSKSFNGIDFMKTWLDAACGKDVSLVTRTGHVVKLLGKNDTVESICIEYDLTRV